MQYINLLNIKAKQTSQSNTNKSILNIGDKKISLSMKNMDVGICPKCQKSMSSASIASGEACYYCETCRVSLPKEN